MIHEKTTRSSSGWMPLFLCLIGLAGGLIGLIFCAINEWGWGCVASVLLTLVSFVCLFGLITVAPNQARVLLLFGVYKGTIIESGFYWVNPFLSKKKISLRVRNFETGSTTTPEEKNQQGIVVKARTRTASRPSKVNDKDGNPIEISAVVVWKVVDTAEAMFEVEDFEHFVEVQSESALRNLASRHPYDSEEHEVSLRGSTEEVSHQLQEDIQARLEKAGCKVLEARISHLAYAPEIAAAMLQRQQAQAVVAARTKIVEGAVGMVEMALDHLAKDEIVELDEERKAAMVSNLLVVLCSDRHTQPVVNAGSLY